MTDAHAQTPKIPLGVGAIISNSFSILFKNFPKVLALGFIGSLIVFLSDFLLLGANKTLSFGDPSASEPSNVGAFLASLAITMLIYSLTSALLIQLAYDAKLGRRNSIGTYIRFALPAVLPIAILSLVVGLLAAIGAIGLIIGAFFVYAMFYVMAPVAVIERTGFGSLRRSVQLTKGYLWSIVGLLLLIYLTFTVLAAMFSFIDVVLANIGGSIFAGIATIILNGLSYAFGGIIGALVYARLREIKEGVDVDQIAAVFD
ncbi:MAG: hypothetical protein ABJ249_00970 [Lentilitoribacter sp.]